MYARDKQWITGGDRNYDGPLLFNIYKKHGMFILRKYFQLHTLLDYIFFYSFTVTRTKKKSNHNIYFCIQADMKLPIVILN